MREVHRDVEADKHSDIEFSRDGVRKMERRRGCPGGRRETEGSTVHGGSWLSVASFLRCALTA